MLKRLVQLWEDERLLLGVALLFQQAAAFLLMIVLARLLGAGDYGRYALVKTVVTVSATFAPLGLNVSLLRILTEFDSRPEVRIAVFRMFRLIVGLSSLVMGGCILFLMSVFDFFPNQALSFWLALAIGLLSLPLLADISLFGAYFRVTGRVRAFANISILSYSAVNALLSIIAVLFSKNYVAVIVANSIALAGVFLALNRRLPAENPAVRPATQQVQASAYDYFGTVVLSLWMAGATFAYTLMRGLDLVMLGRFLPSQAVGSYSLLSALAYVIFIAPLALSQTLGPDVARAHELGGSEQIKARYTIYFREAGIVSAFFAGGIAAFGDQLSLFVGNSFQLAPSVALLLALSQLISALLAPTGFALSMTGHHRQEFVLLGLSTLVMAFGLYFAVPAYGVKGAALVSLAVYALANGARYMLVRLYLGIWMMSWRDLLPVLVAFSTAYAFRLSLGLVETTILAMVAACMLYAAVFWFFYGRVLVRFSGKMS